MESNAPASADPAAWYEQALAHYRGREVEAAAECCRRVLELAPAHAPALNLAGVIAFQRRDLPTAIERFAAAARAAPGAALVHVHLGNAQLDLGDPNAALASYEVAIALDPAHAEAHSGRGNALFDLDRLEDALASFEAAIAARPELVAAHVNRALTLYRQRRFAAAVAGFERALQLAPGAANLHYHLGIALGELQRMGEALASFETALRLQPDYVEALNGRGNALAALHRYGEALADFEQALARLPQHAQLHLNRAEALRGLGRAGEALAACDRALELDPQSAAAHTSRAAALLHLARYDAAIEACDRAIAQCPDLVDAHLNRGYALRDSGRRPAAIEAIGTALALRPANPHAEFDLACLYLSIGRWDLGWPLYEARNRRKPLPANRRFAAPAWAGDAALEGKTLFVWADQGLGDSIQFCRFIPQLQSRGARVVLALQRSLHELIGRFLPDVPLLAEHELAIEFDHHCALGSLPGLCAARPESIPFAEAYLRADPARRADWQERLRALPRPRIGLCWSGNPLHGNDHRRSISLATVLEHLPAEGSYVSLQQEVRAEDAAALRVAERLVDVGAALRDFSDTAALCACLDRIVTVDTSVAHLAGAIGRPTSILLPFNSDWRWLLERADSPWYRSVRLYRQPGPNSWPQALARLARDLLLPAAP